MQSEITKGPNSNAFQGFLRALEVLGITYELQPSGFNLPHLAHFKRDGKTMVVEHYAHQGIPPWEGMVIAIYEQGSRPERLEYEGRTTILKYAT